jgi:hypothetical protein
MQYRLYGCTLQADRVIHGPLPSTETDTDIAITFHSSPSWGKEEGCVVDSTAGLLVRRLEAGYHFVYHDDGTEFLVSSEGDRIAAATSPRATLADTCTYLVGPVMGFTLRLRGLVCLHASTVIIDHGAVVFCGPPSAGKSTTAAAFAQRGFAVLAEDVAVLDDRSGAFSVQPGYPRVNLWPDGAAALCGTADALPAITPNWGKRYLPLSGPAQFHSVPAPLAAIYILGSRGSQSRPEIRQLTGVEALLALASNTYTPYLLDSAMRAREFEVLRRLVAHVPVRHVKSSDDLSGIGGLCDALLQDYCTLAKVPT